MDPRLFMAAKSGDLSALQQVFDTDPNVLHDKTPNGNTALHLAVIFRHEDFSKELLHKCRILLPIANNNADTPLLLAAATGLLTIVRSFVETRWSDVELGNVSMKYMMMKTNRTRNNALHEALRKGHGEMALELLRAEPELATVVNKNMESPMYMACYRSMTEVVEVLLRLPVATYGGPNGETALHKAVFLGHSGMVNALMKERPGIGQKAGRDGRNPLHFASEFNKLEIVQLLLELDASLAYSVDHDDKPPILWAAMAGNAGIVEEIIRRCPDSGLMVSKNGNNALHIAIDNKRLAVVEYILRTPELERLINQPNDKGEVPLHRAAWVCNTKILRALLEDERVDKVAANNLGWSSVGVFLSRGEPRKTLQWNEAFLMLTAAVPSLRKMYIGKLVAQEKLADKPTPEVKSMIQAYTNNTTLVATLIATVSYAAAFTVPGGYIGDAGPNQGLPVLAKKAAFKVFLISDTVAMCSSLAVAFLYIFAGWEDIEFLNHYRNSTRKLMWCGFAAMLVAFATGLYTVVAPDSLWLATIFCVLCCGLPIVTILLSKWPILKQRFRLGRKFMPDLLPKV